MTTDPTRLAAAPPVVPDAPADGAALIAAERRRQTEEEGWTPEHDDTHDDGEFRDAAVAYITRAERFWPWGMSGFKLKSTRENLIRAGALIAAEIDRIDRAAAPLPLPADEGQPTCAIWLGDRDGTCDLPADHRVHTRETTDTTPLILGHAFRPAAPVPPVAPNPSAPSEQETQP